MCNNAPSNRYMKDRDTSRFFLCIVGSLLALSTTCVQIHAQESAILDPGQTAPRVAQWRDLKFGFMMHWGLYSVAGGV